MIEAYRLFAYDQGWRQRMRDAVRTGLTAEAAVERVQDEMRLRVQRLGDPFFANAPHDFDDLARRLLRHLHRRRRQPRDLPRDAVLVARAIGAGRVAGLWPRQSAGRWCWRKPPRPRMSPSWRAPWACRWSASLEGIADSARAGDAIVVDGETGEVHLRPPGEIVTAFEEKRALRRQPMARFAAVRDLPAVTRDGVAIRLMMNAGLELDMPHLTESGADGIGLFRTELQFMIGETMPRLADQMRILPQNHRCGGRQAGGIPHARSGRRQGLALWALGARGKSRAGLARHPHRARPARAAALPGARADNGVGRTHAAHPACPWSAMWTNSTAPAPWSIASWSGRG